MLIGGGGGWDPVHRGGGVMEIGPCTEGLGPGTGNTPVNRQTYTTENITFQEHRWRVVTIRIISSNEEKSDD